MARTNLRSRVTQWARSVRSSVPPSPTIHSKIRRESYAERRAWATVNATTHGGKKSGSGRGRAEDHSPERKGGHIGGSSQSHAKRSRAAKKGWETRRRES